MTPLLFFLAAFFGGAINSVAGGGSFLLFPVLIVGGMSPVAANIMCTITLWPAAVSSSVTYCKELKTPFASFKYSLAICIIGSVLGAWLLLALPEATFESLVPWLLLAATLIFTFGRRMVAWWRKDKITALNHHDWRIAAVMLVIALYGGYFGAGIGILTLAMLQLAGYKNMHEMNALKTILTSTIQAASMLLFVISGSVLWEWTPILIAGGIAGGYVGTKLALKVHPEKVRRLVMGIAIVMTTYFFLRGV